MKRTKPPGSKKVDKRKFAKPPTKRATKETRPLTHKQKRFCEYYVRCWNATEAARKAGYSGNDNNLAVIGHQNLKKLKIKEYIQERMDEVTMGTDEILQRLTAMGRGTVEPFVEPDNVSVTLTAESEEAKQALGLVKKIKQYETQTQDGNVSRRFELELHDAKDAIIQLAKIRGMYIDRVDHTSSDGSMSPPRTLADIYAEENSSGESES